MGFLLTFETVFGTCASWDIGFESCHLNLNNFNASTHVTLFYSHIMAVEEFEYAYAHLSLIKVEIF